MSGRTIATDLKDLWALGRALGLKGFEDGDATAAAALVKPDPDVAALRELARGVGLKGFADAPTRGG